MAQIISVNDYDGAAGRKADDYLSAVPPLTVRDFMELARSPLETAKRTCLAGDSRAQPPQSQVDRLISDLMDIIVRASGGPAEKPVEPAPSSEMAALSMMQALLQKQVCSSF